MADPDATISKVYVGLNLASDDQGNKFKNYFVIKGTNLIRRRTTVKVKRGGELLFKGKVWELLRELQDGSTLALVRVEKHDNDLAVVGVPTSSTDDLTITVENPDQTGTPPDTTDEEINIYED